VDTDREVTSGGVQDDAFWDQLLADIRESHRHQSRVLMSWILGGNLLLAIFVYAVTRFV